MRRMELLGMPQKMLRSAVLSISILLPACGAQVEDAPAEVNVAYARLIADSNCTDDENNQLLWTYQFVASGIDQARMATSPAVDMTRWDRWFDVNYTQASIDEVMRVLGDIKDNALPNLTVHCERNDGSGGSGDPACQNPNTYAFVRESDNIMHICPKFFSHMDGVAQINVIVHEGGHKAIPNYNDYSSADAPAAEALANWSPDQALKNAANYAHFVTNDPNIRL